MIKGGGKFHLLLRRRRKEPNHLELHSGLINLELQQTALGTATVMWNVIILRRSGNVPERWPNNWAIIFIKLS